MTTTFNIRFSDHLMNDVLTTRPSNASNTQKFVRNLRNESAIAGTTVAALAMFAMMGVGIAGGPLGRFNLSFKGQIGMFFGAGLGGLALGTFSVLGIYVTSMLARNSNKAIEILNTEKDYTEEEMFKAVGTLGNSHYWYGTPENQSTLSDGEKRVLGKIYTQWNDFVIKKVESSNEQVRGDEADDEETYAAKIIAYVHYLHNVDLRTLGKEFNDNYGFMHDQFMNYIQN